MRRSNAVCRSAAIASGLLVIASQIVAAAGPKQTVEVRGLSFQVPTSWKSIPPSSQMRLAQLKVDPIEGDDYPAELVVTAFPGQAGSVDANLKRWQGFFKHKDGSPPRIESKTVKAKNVDVIRAETSGDYHPPQMGRPEPDRQGARLLAAIVTTREVTYYLRMVGPDKTMTKLRADFDELLSSIQVADR
jgi:hypothetical protein